MGRRSQHTPDELRELILTATRRVVEDEGIAQPSAREIARAIGYAPGTLYNMFDNLADILLHVEARIWKELDDHLEEALRGAKQRDALTRFVNAYVGFASDHTHSWALILKHQPDAKAAIPHWYLERVYAPQGRLEQIIARQDTKLDPDEIARRARLAWSVLHGLIQVAMTTKFGATQQATLSKMTLDAVEAAVGSFAANGAERPGRRTDDGPRPSPVAG